MKKLIFLLMLFAISAFAGLADLQTVDLLYRGVPPYGEPSSLTLYSEPQDTTYKAIKISGKLFVTREYQKIDTLKIEVK